MFFPSVLEHYVTSNQSDEVRATISANFTINERIDEEKNTINEDEVFLINKNYFVKVETFGEIKIK